MPVRTAVQQAGLDYDSAEVSFVPEFTQEVDEPTAEKLIRIIEALEDSDDVQNVYANFDAPDEVACQPADQSHSAAEHLSRLGSNICSIRGVAEMRVLGIDPGLTRCGLGVVDGVPGRPPQLVAVDVVRTSAEPGHRPPAGRDRGRPSRSGSSAPADAVAVERVFAQHNVQTVMGTAQAAGVAMLVAARHGIPVSLHTPSEVKAAITGSGRAAKDQVGAMVTRILQLDEAPRPADAADALALAICHVWRAARPPG